MAITAQNLHSLSSASLPSTSSFTFQIPNKTPQISCFVRPIQLHNLGYGFSNLGISTQKSSFNFHGSRFARDLIVAQATEAVAPTSEGQASSEPKPLKKKKEVIKYPRRYVDQYQVLQFPIITEAAVKNIAEENSLLFTVDVRADKLMIKDAVKNLFGVKVRKVNTAIRPDGTKKAHIMLSKEDSAAELAKKIGIFPSSD